MPTERRLEMSAKHRTTLEELIREAEQRFQQKNIEKLTSQVSFEGLMCEDIVSNLALHFLYV